MANQAFRCSDLCAQPTGDGGSTFSYDLVPLPSPATHIRLIELLPPVAVGSASTPVSETPLRCRISSAPLTLLPPFAALSYTWGDNKAARYLSIQPSAAAGCSQDADGGMTTPTLTTEFSLLRITPSLEGALRHIRRPSEPVTLWVDQICIDQGNVPEKNAQVAAMKDVYSGASQVLVWLGLSSPTSDWFVDRMRALGTLARHEGVDRLFDPTRRTADEYWRFINGAAAGDSRAPDQPASDGSFEGFFDKASAALLGDGGTSNEVFAEELRAWLARPWFTRVWVLQEYALARSAVFIYGNKTIETELFMLAYHLLALTGPRALHMERDSGLEGMKRRSDILDAGSDGPLESLSRLRWRCRSHKTEGNHSGYSLFEVLRDLYSSDRPQMLASDQRDRIYALLNLAADTGDLGIVPDYSDSLTTDLLYTRVARAMLESPAGGIQHVLGLVQFPKKIMNDEAAAQRLPSWVPDFCRLQDSIAEPELYAPTGTAVRAHLLPSREERILGLRGILVDHIKLTGELWGGGIGRYARGDTTDLNRLVSYFSEVKRILGLALPREATSAQGTDDERRRDAPWRIMLGDVAHDSNRKLRRAGPHDMESMRQLLELTELLNILNPPAAENGGVAQQAMANPEQLEAILGRVYQLVMLPEVPALILRLESMRGKRPYLTQNMGYAGMGPSHARPGDAVVLLPGAQTPYVIRPRPDSGLNHYELVGEAYCDGIMDGEAMDRPLDDIYLV